MLIYIIAGEPSGDLLGARLLAALTERTGGEARFAGIGGPAMKAQGLDSLFLMSELSVMGLVEVLPRIPRILGLVKQTVAHIGQLQPDVVITIDSWGFTGRVQKTLQAQFPKIGRIHFVAPTVWAWKPGRARKLAAIADMLMALFPFEPPYFEREGLKTVHVGHSVVEGGADKGDGAAFRARHGIGADEPLLVALPGSRLSETSRLLPVYAQVMDLLAATCPGLKVAVPTVDTVSAKVREAAAGWALPAIVVEGAERFDAFAAGDVALAASGTVSFELALAKLPAIITYRVSPLSAFVATRFLGLGKSLRWVTMVNILMGREIIPEYLQDRCRPELLAEAVTGLLADEGARNTMRTGMAEAMAMLGYGGGDRPSLRAADAVLDFIADRRTP